MLGVGNRPIRHPEGTIALAFACFVFGIVLIRRSLRNRRLTVASVEALVLAVAFVALGVNQVVEVAIGHIVNVVDTLCVLTIPGAGIGLLVSRVSARRRSESPVREPTIRQLLAAERKERRSHP